MILFLAAVAALCMAVLATFGRFQRRSVLLLGTVALPALFAAAMLLDGRGRLETLRLTYTGKQIELTERVPLTIGGSAAAAEIAEDLHHASLPPEALEIALADAALAEQAGVELGDPVLRVTATPVPVVRIDGVLRNEVILQEGDRLILGSGQSVEETLDTLELVLRDGGLELGARRFELPGEWAGLARGAGEVFFLPDLLRELEAETPQGGWPQLSFLHRPRAFGPWHLVLRDRSTRVMRGDVVAGELAGATALPRRGFELQLLIVWGGGPGQRRLRTIRRDRITFEEGQALVRFTNPQRLSVPLAGREAAFEMGIVVPSTVDRRRELLEIDERSPRFRGLSAGLRYDPSAHAVQLSHLGATHEVVPDHLAALGEGADRLLIRLEKTELPRRVLVDLALLGLFLAIALGPMLARDVALPALMAPVGVLIAARLLFAERAASQPPHYFALGYGEARLALWLVPAMVVVGWTLAWLLRRDPGTTHLRALRWPLLALGLAGLGAYASTRGAGNLSWLAFLPWLAGASLVALVWAFQRDTLGVALRRWQSEGWSLSLRAVVLCGLAILAVRWVGVAFGMPEALRVPALRFRVLWTVLQLPLCAVLLALALYRIDALRRDRAAAGDGRGLVRTHVLGICAVGLFAGMAFAGVAAVVSDTGLLLVHALPAVFGLLLLVDRPPVVRHLDAPWRIAHGAGTALAVLPLVLILVANLAPAQMMRAVDAWSARAAESVDDPQEVVDRAARLRSLEAQQVFRLYMLANPGLLREVGVLPSERVAIQYDTLRDYARQAGFLGGGYASSPLPRHLGVTYLNDLAPMVFVLAELGVLGMLGLALLYLTPLVGVLGRVRAAASGRLASQGGWIAAVALLAFALPSLYMILANLNLALFTGKNCNLLGLNSVSDVLESAFLLGLAAFGLGLGRSSA